MIIFLIFSCLRHINQNTENIQLEPPLWFSGLKRSEFLLTINGTNIANYTFSISTIPIINITKLESPNYLFIYLDMSSINPETYNISLSNGQETYILPYEIRPLRPPRPRTFDSSDVIYLIMPDRFSDGNTTLDNVTMRLPYSVNRTNPDTRHGGDLQGILNHLDYLTDLGVTALWLTPILENDVGEGSYHGYAATNLYKVDPRFGSNTQYVSFVTACHSQKVKVIQDFVFNHVSSKHPWMEDPPTPSFFNFFEHFVQTQSDLTAAFSPYASDFDRELLTKGWFVDTMPDLNQRNAVLGRYLVQTSVFWIEYADIDGIRMDTYPYAFAEFMSAWCKEVSEQYPDFNIVGETFRTNTAAVSFFQAMSKLNANSTNMKSVMDFHLMDVAHDVFFGEDKMGTLHDHMSYDFLYPNASSVMRFLENHDTDRFFRDPPISDSDIAAFKMAMAFIATAPGIPQIYYGTEVGISGRKDVTDGYVRKDFPGGWDGDPIDLFTEDGRKEDRVAQELFEYLKALLNYRRGNELISSGRMMHFFPKEGVYAYTRRLGDRELLVFLNGKNEQVAVALEQYEEALDGGFVFRDVVGGGLVYLNGSLTLAGKQALVLELQGGETPTPPPPQPTTSTEAPTVTVTTSATVTVFPTDTATASAEPSSSGDKSKEVKTIVACCVGGVAVVAVIVAASVFVCRKSKGKRQLNEDPLLSLKKEEEERQRLQ